MPPLMRMSDQLDAAVLGASWVISRGEPELAKAAKNLLAKIEAVLPDALHSYIREPATSIAPVVRPDEQVDAAQLRRAIRSGRKVKLEYLVTRVPYRVVSPGRISSATATAAVS